MLKVVVLGANGKMGKCVEMALSQMKGFEIVARIQREDDLETILKSTKPDIAIDVTSHESVLKNSWCLVKNGVRTIIGTSGLSMKDMDDLSLYCQEKKLGTLIIPNFSLAFALINRVSKEFSKYFDDVSIVEFHHAQKKDKPSGTARYSAEIFGLEESHIASVRSNGFLAKQQIYINSDSERIILDHESFNRSSFIKGIQLSLNKVTKINGLIVGLENVLDC
jgi:4-hydroxy-tetrahydrodipicolinate reductase